MEAYTRTGARIVLALIFICFISYCRAQNGPVIRCGGFIQASPALVESDLAVDYSPISISIITSTGVIKETTECAPNGYYLLPIYESGDFRIIVEGPEGWNFQPESVPITTDNGECNNGERVNFEITGFSITGSILSPSCEGGVSMNGVVVTLLRDGKNVDKFHFQRGDGPNYSFKNVLPGQYEIKASHPSWTFSKDSTRAIVAWGSVHAENLEISGYDISGKVLSSEGDSMKNVDLNLYSSQSGSQAIQTVQSDSEGKFRVTNVECGVYELIPTFKGEHTTYDLAPSKATIQVKGDSVSIDEAFRVVGFSANGRVVNQNNVGIAGVQVLLNREVQTTTDQQGNFRLEKLESGEYDVEFRLPHHSFPMLSSIKITPNQATIAPVKLSGVDICGAAVIDSAKITKQRTIQLQDLQGNEIASTLSNAQGEYCFQSVSPQGEYRIVPTVHSSEAAALLFEPESIQVSVNNQPLYNQNFSQSKVSVGRTVACLQKPSSSSIVIQLTSPDDTTLHISTSVDPATGRFEMKGIYPGQYQISVEESSWCWEKTHHTISVQGNPIEDISFVQSGYKAIIHSSHQVEIKYSNKQANSHEVIQAKVGKNELCVVQEGDYEFVPDSCFKFNKDKIQWNTNNPSEIKFSVTHYPIRGSITAPSTTNPDDLSVIVKSISGTERTLPVSKADNGIFTYHYWSSLGDQIDITPHSTGDLLFYPASLKVNVEDPNSCPNEVDAFSARPGLFIEGKIEPVPIAGVEITVKQKTGEVMVKVKSNEEGLYRAGPLYDHLQYSLEAHLDGYYFTSCENGFKAVELSQIKITAVDQYGEKIPGVLLSLTGDAAFYRDSDTNELGEGYFDELFPGTYYLRCLLKEYSFKPTNIPIDLQEGIEHKLTVNGTRVAYSAFGSVKSLSGEAERNVIVFAKSDLGDYEETQTDSKGNFRLRGLKPSVQYSFQVKTTDRIERASPSVIQKEIPTEDILDVDFIAFRDSNRVDICGSVETEDEFLDSLSVELYVHNKKQNQQELLKTFSLDTFRTFSFPNLPLEEYTLKLISSLNQNIYEYKVTPVDIDADRMRKEGKIGNGVIFVPFVFRASPKIQTTEIHANVSFYPLLVLSVLFFIFWYRSHIREYYHAARAPQKQTREPSWIPHHVANHGKPSQTQKKKKKKN